MSKTIVLGVTEEPKLIEDDDVAEEIETLQALNRLNEAEAAAAKAEVLKLKTDDLEKELRRRATRAAADAKEAAEDAAKLRDQIPASESLADLLAAPPEAEEFVIDGLLPTGARALFPAARKSGKTTGRNELVRSLVDGVPFLGYFQTKARSKVTVIDIEMSRAQTYRWLADLGIENTAAVNIVSLRGKAATFNILDEATRAVWAEILTGSDVVILDCLRPILDALGLNENTDAGQFLVAFDALLDEAGASEAVVLDHAGHGNDRARGDSRKEDWADVLWYQEMADRQDPASERKFRAMGRDVEVAQGVLEYDAETRRLTYRPPVPDAVKASKDAERKVRNTEARSAVMEYVRGQNRVGVDPTKRDTEQYAGEDIGRRAIRDAVQQLLESGELVPGSGRGHRLHAVDPMAARPLKAVNPFSDPANAQVKACIGELAGTRHRKPPNSPTGGEFTGEFVASSPRL